MSGTRIRQLVFASHNHGDIDKLKSVLGLGPAFVDKGVGEFGLTNGVFALGDQFLEVVVPVEDNTAAGRFLDRGDGKGGYMIIFQTEDLAAVRGRADALHLRRVWNIDLPDIAASHLHPADMGAAIVSIDEPHPEGAWRWGGPDWQDHSRPGHIAGVTVAATQPEVLAEKWAGVLGVRFHETGPAYEVELSVGQIKIIPGETDRLTNFHLAVPDPDGVLTRAARSGLPMHDDRAFQLMGVCVTVSAH
ncbi:MAG: VOC family protein [Henriciella sp.]|nr:VOC family protein [Henriciella sp.]